jgi:hypothetical protein
MMKMIKQGVDINVECPGNQEAVARFNGPDYYAL